MRRQIAIFLFLFLGFLCGLPAQTRQARKSFRKAARHYRKFEYFQAIPWLRDAVNLDPEDALYSYLLGECYFLSGKERNSLPYFERAQEKDPEVDPKLPYYLGSAMHLNGNYEGAIPHLRKFLEITETDSQLAKNAMLRIEQCQTALEFSKRPNSALVIKNLGEFVNTPFPEYGPSFSADGQTMIYTARRPVTAKKQAKPGYYMEDFNEEVFVSERVEVDWMKSRLFANELSKFTHDAGIALTEEGNALLYYVDRDSGDIFISRKKGNGKWGPRLTIGDSINSIHHEPSAFITPDGQRLYFVSTRPGGYGGKDIWIADLMPTGEWGNVRNPGGALNSPREDDAPYISRDGKWLYFASQGHNSIGGYDIFRCPLDKNGNPGRPENLGLPLNSPGDDLFFVESNADSGFYFSSDRKGGFGSQDLYYAYQADSGDLQLEMVRLQGKISQPGNEGKRPGFMFFADRKNGELLSKRCPIAVDGTFSVEVLSGDLPYGELVFELDSIKAPAVVTEIVTENVDTILTSGQVQNGPEPVIDWIFFDFGKSSLSPAYRQDLQMLARELLKNSDSRVKILGYADPEGDAERNQQLSARRAKAVASFLAREGVSMQRMEWTGKGELKSDWMGDSERHKWSRRVEIYIEE